MLGDRVMMQRMNGGMDACRRAWKRAVHQTHPEKTGSTEPFIRVTEAYKALMATC